MEGLTAVEAAAKYPELAPSVAVRRGSNGGDVASSLLAFCRDDFTGSTNAYQSNARLMTAGAAALHQASHAIFAGAASGWIAGYRS